MNVVEEARVTPILCSEQFLEKASQAAAELSSGRCWRDCFTSSSPGGEMEHTQDISNSNMETTKFELHDCDLVDSCGIDLELPGRVGVKVVFLSKTFHPKDFTKEVVGIASSIRYDAIHLLFVMDVDGDAKNYFHEDLSILQNALVKQRGCPCQK